MEKFIAKFETVGELKSILDKYDEKVLIQWRGQPPLVVFENEVSYIDGKYLTFLPEEPIASPNVFEVRLEDLGEELKANILIDANITPEKLEEMIDEFDAFREPLYNQARQRLQDMIKARKMIEKGVNYG